MTSAALALPAATALLLLFSLSVPHYITVIPAGKKKERRVFSHFIECVVFLLSRSGSDPVRIKSPPELADQTVEERLITFDWDKNFHTFQEATRRGAFRPLCWGKTQALIDVSPASFNSLSDFQ